MSKRGIEFKISPSPRMEFFWQDKMKDAFPGHFHGHYVIGCLLRGERIYHLDGESGRLVANQIMLINPGQIHQCESSGKSSSSWLALHFPVQTLCSLAGGKSEKDAIPLFQFPVLSDNAALEKVLALALEPDENKARALVNHIFRLQEHLASKNRGMAGNLAFSRSGAMGEGGGGKPCPLYLPGRLPKKARTPGAAEKSIAEQADTDRQKLLLAIRAICADFISEPWKNISLDEIAEKAKMGRFTFLRKFKKTMGISPCRYLELLRLNLARDGLSRGQGLCQCAQNFGYYDQSHMSRQFTAHFGITPGQMRKAFSNFTPGEK